MVDIKDFTLHFPFVYAKLSIARTIFKCFTIPIINEHNYLCWMIDVYMV